VVVRVSLYVYIDLGWQAALDISAYLPYAFWKKLLEELDITEKQIRERYTAVVHLVLPPSMNGLCSPSPLPPLVLVP
jgi:hypothetical protein